MHLLLGNGSMRRRRSPCQSVPRASIAKAAPAVLLANRCRLSFRQLPGHPRVQGEIPIDPSPQRVGWWRHSNVRYINLPRCRHQLVPPSSAARERRVVACWSLRRRVPSIAILRSRNRPYLGTVHIEGRHFLRLTTSLLYYIIYLIVYLL